EEPSSQNRVHSIAMRKQTTVKPETIPIMTASKRNNWPSRRVSVLRRQMFHSRTKRFAAGASVGIGAAAVSFAAFIPAWELTHQGQRLVHSLRRSAFLGNRIFRHENEIHRHVYLAGMLPYILIGQLRFQLLRLPAERYQL